MTFDPNRPHACRDGSKAYIGFTTPVGFSGHVVDGYGNLMERLWLPDGRCVGNIGSFDLINTPEQPKRKPRTVWVNIYGPDDLGTALSSREEALACRRHDAEELPVEFREVLPEDKPSMNIRPTPEDAETELANRAADKMLADYTDAEIEAMNAERHKCATNGPCSDAADGCICADETLKDRAAPPPVTDAPPGELPDDIRVPLHSLIADTRYLFGRVALDGSCASVMAESVLDQLHQIETALAADAITRLTARAEAADARVKELEAKLAREVRAKTDQKYMANAYYQMLGPVGLEVADMWTAKGVLRVHHDWGPSAAKLTGEERAQCILEIEHAVKTPVGPSDIDAHTPPPDMTSTITTPVTEKENPNA